MNIGRRLYYIKITGDIALDTGERSGNVIATTVDDDFAIYAALTHYNRDALGVMELEYGQHAEDFRICNGVRVDVSTETHALLFSYPPEGGGVPEEPVYQAPMQQRISTLERQLTDTQVAMTEVYEQLLTITTGSGS